VTRRPAALVAAALSASVALVAGRGLGGRAAAEEAAKAAPADAPAPEPSFRPQDPGTAVLGFGLLRVSPTAPGVPGRVRLRFSERPTAYAPFDAVQLLVAPADAFEAEGRAFADACVAYARSAKGVHAVQATFPVSKPALLVVAYGPYEGADAGRPLTLARVVTLEVESATGANARFVDAEAGEMNVKSWRGRPGVARGGPVRDAGGLEHWFEVRPLVLYDASRLRAAGEPPSAAVAGLLREADALETRARDAETAGRAAVAAELRAEAATLRGEAAASDERLPVPQALAERLRRPPLRWK
jgi:hypothetical protein